MLILIKLSMTLFSACYEDIYFYTKNINDNKI